MFRRLVSWLGKASVAPVAIGSAFASSPSVDDDEVINAIRAVPIHLMYTMLKDCKITRVSNAAVAGTTDIESSRVDMTGFDSVMFVALLGDVTSGSVLTLTAKSNAADSTTSSTSEKAGTVITAGASDYDNKLLIVDLHKPTLRYAYCTLLIDTQNAVVDGIIAIQYNAKNHPVTQGSTVGDGVVGGPNA